MTKIGKNDVVDVDNGSNNHNTREEEKVTAEVAVSSRIQQVQKVLQTSSPPLLPR